MLGFRQHIIDGSALVPETATDEIVYLATTGYQYLGTARIPLTEAAGTAGTLAQLRAGWDGSRGLAFAAMSPLKSTKAQRERLRELLLGLALFTDLTWLPADESSAAGVGEDGRLRALAAGYRHARDALTAKVREVLGENPALPSDPQVDGFTVGKGLGVFTTAGLTWYARRAAVVFANYDTKTEEQRAAALKTMAAELAVRDEITVTVVEDTTIVAPAQYDSRDRKVQVNPRLPFDDFSAAYMLLHEVRHAFQHEMAQRLEDSDTPVPLAHPAVVEWWSAYFGPKTLDLQQALAPVEDVVKSERKAWNAFIAELRRPAANT